MMWLIPESKSYTCVLWYLIPCGVMINLMWKLAAIQSRAVSQGQETLRDRHHICSSGSFQDPRCLGRTTVCMSITGFYFCLMWRGTERELITGLKVENPKIGRDWNYFRIWVDSTLQIHSSSTPLSHRNAPDLASRLQHAPNPASGLS
jgi:hypothetical protein